MLIKNTCPHVSTKEGKVVGYGIDVPFGPANKPDVVYKFRPTNVKENPEGDQVCEVKDPEHIVVFQSIPERFELMPETKEDKDLARKLQEKAQALKDERVTKAKAEQDRLNREAQQRQKRAKDTRGKKAEAVSIADFD